MTFEDELQRRFDSAQSAIQLDPGSPQEVRGRASRQLRNRRVVGGIAATLVVLGLGSLLLSLSARDGSVDVAAGAAAAIDHTSGITDSDFTYLGAFKLPAGDWGDSRFAFGGEAAAFYAGGDPDSDDGFDGSLFVSGHPTRNPGVAEVAIPAPIAHDGTSEVLPIADVLRPFVDITDGRAAAAVATTDEDGTIQSRSFRFSGLEVIDTAGGPRLAWTIWQYQNASNNIVAGHGHSSVDLRDPSPEGPWFLGDYDSRATAGYIFDVPEAFAKQNLDGFRLLTGLQDGSAGGETSSGPPFFAFNAPTEAAAGDRVDVLPLAFYEGEPQRLSGFGRADSAGGAEWISTSAGENAVIVVGSRGLGEARNGVAGPDDCGNNAGTHAGPYEPRVLFYDPQDFAKLATGELEAWQLQPYFSWNPAEFLLPTCEWLLTSVSFDEQSRRVYVVQVQADLSQSEFSPVPVVHVFGLA